MSIFINRAKLRKLELMEYLNRFSDPVPIQQILNHFNTTRNAVFGDLNGLQKKYPELTIFQTTKMVYLRILTTNLSSTAILNGSVLPSLLGS